MEQWVGHVMESRPGWSPMQSVGIGSATSAEFANQRFAPSFDNLAQMRELAVKISQVKQEIEDLYSHYAE
jgi:hypothetical protein